MCPSFKNLYKFEPKERVRIKAKLINWQQITAFWFLLQSTSAILNTRYLELSLYRTFYLVPSPFSVSFPYKSIQYLELGYLKLSLCRTIFSVPSDL